MPQAPLLSPDQAPSSQGAPEVNLPVPYEAFGGAVDKALEGLGSGIEQAGDRIWSRAMEMQNLQNETKAKEQDAGAMVEMGIEHANFINKEGQNAGPEALAAHIQKLQEIRMKYREGLNPMAARMYDASSLSFMGRNILNAAGHSGQQMKVSANNAAASRINTTSDNIAANPKDEITFQRGVRAIQSEVDRQADLGGWTDDQRAATKENQVSQAVAKRIVGLSRTDAIGAKSMFDQATKSGALTAVDASKVEASVQNQFRQQGSRNISDQILSKYKAGEEDDKTEQDYLDEGQKEAEATAKRLGITDPLFVDFVRDRISADYRRQKAVTVDGQQAAEQTVAAAMMQGNKEGILPKSVDELKLIDPSVASAWDTMKPTTQKKYMAVLAQNANGDRVAWTNQNLGTYRTLKGMAHDDPVQFLAHDVIADKLPSSAKRELINLQQRLRNQSESDPRVTRALSILGPDLQAAGISRTGNKDDYYQFVGALQDQLDQYQHENKKVPKAEEIKVMGAQLMQEQHHSWWQSHQGFYQIPVPDEERARLRSDPYWADHNITPRDDMLDRVYRAQKFKELYGGSAKKQEVQFPPNAPTSQ